MLNKPTSIQPRPMGNINSAMRDLDMNADRVRELVDCGILVAFNIAVRPRRAELRILTRSIEHCRETEAKRAFLLEWPEVFRLILPNAKDSVRGMEVGRALNCDRGHVENLIAAKLLVVSQPAKPGPGGSPVITRDSFENFLIGRQQ